MNDLVVIGSLRFADVRSILDSFLKVDASSLICLNLLFNDELCWPSDRYQVGTPVPRTTCTFTINGLLKRQGEILTPTYPGTYPKDLACAYKFVGKKGQRIRIEFRDFDVFYGGAQ